MYFLAIPDGGGRRVRQDPRSTRPTSRSTARSLSVTPGRPGREPADFAPPPTRPTARAGPRPTAPPGRRGWPALREPVRGGRRSMRTSGSVASTCATSRASPSPRARRRSPARPASSSSAATSSSSSPTRATRSRRVARRRRPGRRRATATCRRAGRSSWRRSGRGASASRPALCRTRWARLGGGRAGRRAGPGRGLGRGRPGDQGAGRARTGRRGVRRRRPGARDAPARRSGPGVTEHDLALELEWLMRTGGAEAVAFDAACLAGRRRRCRTVRPAIGRPDGRGAPVRLRGAGRRLSQRHDADAVRRRADRARPRRVRAGRARTGGGDRGARGVPAAAGGRCRAGGRSTRSPARVIARRRPRRPVRPRDGHGIGLATHEAPSLGPARPRDAAAAPDGVLRGARDLPRGARRASGSRTSSRSTRRPGRSSA